MSGAGRRLEGVVGEGIARVGKRLKKATHWTMEVLVERVMGRLVERVVGRLMGRTKMEGVIEWVVVGAAPCTVPH